uniref:Uncharacterized protein n=1 Tax=Arundo donax TaxID=35708 RepID=A0A0A8ZX46_ARUDO
MGSFLSNLMPRSLLLKYNIQSIW